MDHYPSREELETAQMNYALGRDSCYDREALAVAGGPMYSHLSGCGCDDFWSGISDALAGRVWPF